MMEQSQVLKTAAVGAALFGALAWCRLDRGAAAAPRSIPTTHPASSEKSSAPALHEKLTLRSAVAMLSSDQWSVRSRAQSFLMQENPSQLPVVLNDLRRTHNAEKANRLLKVALQLYLMARTPVLGGPVSFLGVQYNMQRITVRLHGHHIACAAVQVVAILPGFPAAAVLRDTDMIIGINGRIFPLWMTADAFRQQIQALKPGDMVRLSVLRGLSVVSLPVRLVGVPRDMGQLGAMLAQRQAAAAAFVARYER